MLITWQMPSKAMEMEAAAGRTYHSPGWESDYPQLQVLIIAPLLAGAVVKMPPAHGTFKPAPRTGPGAVQQGWLDG